MVDVTRWYLAGPMSGIPQFNFPAFDAAAKELRERGYTVITPSELDDEEERARALASPDGSPSDAGRTWGEFLARDVQLLADGCDGIILLDGWHNSRGARLELFVALTCGKQVARYSVDRILWQDYAGPASLLLGNIIRSYRP